MDSEFVDVLKDFGVVFATFRNSIEERRNLLQQVKLLSIENENLKVNDNVRNNSLLMYKKLITEQQNVISKIINEKERIKECKDELYMKNNVIDELQDEKSILLTTFLREQEKLIQDHKEEIDHLNRIHEEKVRNINITHENTNKENFDKIQELHSQIELINVKRDEQINRIVSEYEKQLHQAHIQAIQMKSEIKTLQEMNRNNVNIYKKKIEDLEKNAGVQVASFDTQAKCDERTDTFNARAKLKMFEIKRNRALEITAVTSNKSRSSIESFSEIEMQNILEPAERTKPAPKKRKLYNKHLDYLED